MNTICIYYDLNNRDRQYLTLIHYLKTFAGYAQAGDGIWFVNSNKSCAQIRDELQGLNHPGGFQVIVFRVGESWSSMNLKPETSEWLHENLKP